MCAVVSIMNIMCCYNVSSPQHVVIGHPAPLVIITTRCVIRELAENTAPNGYRKRSLIYLRTRYAWCCSPSCNIIQRYNTIRSVRLFNGLSADNVGTRGVSFFFF